MPKRKMHLVPSSTGPGVDPHKLAQREIILRNREMYKT